MPYIYVLCQMNRIPGKLVAILLWINAWPFWAACGSRRFVLSFIKNKF
jgi:hypothetical protein